MESSSSPTTTTTTAANISIPAALNLDMKQMELLQPQLQLQQHQKQKMRKCALRIKTKHLQQQSPFHSNNNNKLNISSCTRDVQIAESSRIEKSSRSVAMFLKPAIPSVATRRRPKIFPAKKPEAKGAKRQISAKRSVNTTNITTTTSSTTTTPKEQFLFTLDLLAVVRRNASDKLKLIQMVHDTPILWDSRLPNFKGAEEEKTRAWEIIGQEFNSPGRRVARAFKSLRESYRRELAHVKLMGSGFKPKWSLYEAMDFLRDVIRERKGGSHLIDTSAAAGLNLSALSHQAMSMVHNNNNNNSSSSNNNSLSALSHNSLHSSLNDSALNLSSRSSLNLGQDNYGYYVKRELDLSTSAAHQLQQQAQAQPQPIAAHSNNNIAAQHPDARVSSTRNDNTTTTNNNNNTNNHNGNHNNNNNFDDLDGGSSSPRSLDEASVRCSDGVEELEAIDADFPYPLIFDNSTSPGGGAAVGGAKRRRKELPDGADDDAGDDEDDVDTYGGQMLQQHRHLRQQNNSLDMPPPQTVREVLNSKFCGFISAKLNSMEDTEADNLMNKILMLLVQTQGNAAIQEPNK